MNSQFHVFIVDDDQSVRKALSRLLRAAGYNVSSYASAMEFLAALNPNTTGCVVLDVRMPEVSGDELAVKLMEHGKNLAIIFLTADDDPKIKEKAKKMGAVGFFRKPVDGTALLDAIYWSLKKTNDNNQSKEENNKFNKGDIV
jgi:FixJ family two-component response regulator